jgi:hypothetical protein
MRKWKLGCHERLLANGVRKVDVFEDVSLM